MDFTKFLNKAQIQAALNVTSHTRIIAGAGSGKTRVLTYRMAYLIDELGIDPRKILAITFTNKAANEMKERVENLMDGSTLGMTICTIHSLCVRILREHIYLLDYPRFFLILDVDDQKAILKEIYKDLEIDTKVISHVSALRSISLYKYNLMDVDTLIEESNGFAGEIIRAKIYEKYLEYQNIHKCLDFDDLLIKTVELFEKFPYVLEQWQSRFQYIHVDEFQDISQIEYHLIKCLVGSSNFVCVVGDPDQTIYTFRGANVNYIIDFDKDYQNTSTFYLNENYRSTKKILNVANQLIQNNTNRLKKELFTHLVDGKDVVHYCGETQEEEAHFIVEQIEYIIETVEGVNYHDFAILYRSSYLSSKIEQELLRRHIDYKIYGGIRFTDRKEVKDILSYLRLVAFGDDLALKRVINVPTRSIGKKTIDKIELYAKMHQRLIFDVLENNLEQIGLSTKVKKHLKDFVDLICRVRNLLYQENLSIVECIDYILNESGYLEMLTISQEDDRIENIYQVKNMASEFQKKYDGDSPLEEFLQELPLSNVEDNTGSGEYISLMTIHMSKGLEFKYVFVIGLSDDAFPNFKSVVEYGDSGLEEERRLAYVAFTRAREQLYLTESQGYSHVTKSPRLTSRFIDEIGKSGVIHKGKTQRFKTKDYIDVKETAKTRIGNNHIDQFLVGEHIEHALFGKGVIIKVEDDTIDVAFALPHGIKTIMKVHQAISKC